MPVPSRGMDEVYLISEVEFALTVVKVTGHHLAEPVINEILERMKTKGLTEIKKRDLSESEWECLDWALPSTVQFLPGYQIIKGIIYADYFK